MVGAAETKTYGEEKNDEGKRWSSTNGNGKSKASWSLMRGQGEKAGEGCVSVRCVCMQMCFKEKINRATK